jgi:hypothetical protein
MAMERKL